MKVVPCPNAEHMGQFACANKAQCWEPCGELGNDEKFAIPARSLEERQRSSSSHDVGSNPTGQANSDVAEEVPVAVWSGTIRLFGVDMKCHRLSNGQNVIEEESMRAFLAALETGGVDAGDVEEFARFQAGLAPREGGSNG